MTVDQFARDNPGPPLYRPVWVEESPRSGNVIRQICYGRAYAKPGYAKAAITKRLGDKYLQRIVTETWIEVLGANEITDHRIIT